MHTHRRAPGRLLALAGLAALTLGGGAWASSASGGTGAVPFADPAVVDAR